MNIRKLVLCISVLAGLLPIPHFLSGNCGTDSGSTNNCERSCDRGCESSRSCDRSCESSRSCDSDNDCGRRGNRCENKTIFLPRQLTTDATLELALTNYQIYHPYFCDNVRELVNIQASYFHRQSDRNRRFGNQFIPRNGRVDGENSLERNNFSMRPRRKIDGGYFNFFFDFSQWLCGAWFSVSFAVARVEHHLGMCNNQEQDHCYGNNGDNNRRDIQELDSRFSNNRRCRTSVDDIQFKLGYNYFYNCCNEHVGLYFVATAPTGRRTRGDHVFEPILGTRHGSAGIGVNTDIDLWRCGDHDLRWMSDLKYRYVFKAHECRSFNLDCVQGDAAMVDGDGRRVNFFRDRVKVTPRSTVEFWTALHWAWCEYNFEFGYNMWWRQREKVCMPHLPEVVNCSSESSSSSFSCSSSSSSSNDCHKSSSSSSSDKHNRRRHAALEFDHESGAACHGLSNTVYGGISYNPEVYCMPAMIGVYGSYEFASHRRNLNFWTVSLRGALSF